MQPGQDGRIGELEVVELGGVGPEGGQGKRAPFERHEEGVLRQHPVFQDRVYTVDEPSQHAGLPRSSGDTLHRTGRREISSPDSGQSTGRASLMDSGLRRNHYGLAGHTHMGMKIAAASYGKG